MTTERRRLCLCGASNSKDINGAAKKQSDHVKNIVVLRFLLCGALVLAAGVCSTAAYFLLRQNESELLLSQYRAISTSAVNSVVRDYNRMNHGVKEMASTYSYVFPNETDWPNTAWPGFRPTAEALVSVSALDNIAFSPLVEPSQLQQYESYMKEYYLNDNTVDLDFERANGLQLGMVWNLTRQDFLPTHDTFGDTIWSDKAILAPAAQFTYSEAIGPPYLSFNMHSFEGFAPVFDAIIDCVAANNVTVAHASCGAVSNTVDVPFANFYYPNPVVTDVLAQLAHPIFPASAPEKLVGFMSGAVSWKNLLKLAVPTFITGLDCVISNDQMVYTYTITDGVPTLAGAGDLHDRAYSHHKKSALLESDTLSATHGVKYEISFYPRSTFVRQYTSNVPIYAAIALVGVFVICTAVFLWYDVSMHRESDRKQAILDTKRRFVRFISHEIRTPLNTVRLGMKLFETELVTVGASILKASPSEVVSVIAGALTSWKQLVDDVLTNSETAVEVLDDLLNYDKIEVGNLRLEYSMFNIVDLVKKTASVMQIQAQQKCVNLELVHAPGPRSSFAISAVFIIGDSYRMGQVLRNLVSNALKFTPQAGSVVIRVETKDNGMPYAVVPALEGSTAHLVAHTTRMGSIVVSVKDSGAGLTAKQLQEICAEGVQFNANELQAGQGSGLGLFISKGIVEQHGGRLFVESEGLGKGVTFSVELPVYREPERRASMCMSPPSSMRKLQPAPTKLSLDSEQFDGSQDHTGHAEHLPKRMLVVDDSSFNRKMLVRLLASKGYTCEQAEDGAAALKKYRDATERDEPPDAILMDFEMPVMNGPTATARLREMGCTCLIVGVTGNVLPDEQQYFRDCGADHVLPKPLVIEDFEQLLRRYPADHRVRGLSLDGTTKLHVSAKRDSSLKLVPAFSSRAPSVSRVLPGEEMV